MLRKFNVSVNGKEYLVEMEEIGAPTGVPVVAPAPVVTPVATAQETAAPVAAPTQAPAVAPSGEGETITAPMPGTILKVLVKVGDTVAFEQALVILEAMKMENEIVAPKAGTVSAVYATEGAAIDVGKPIITIV